MICNVESKWFEKIIQYARTAYRKHGSEISGMAPVIIDKNGEMHMLEPVIMKQVCTAANTTLDKDALDNYFQKSTQELWDYVPNNIIYCWWHSHHTMQAYWSGTDQATIDAFAKNGKTLALVVNNKKEYEFIFSDMVDIGGKEHQVSKQVKLNIVNSEVNENIEKEIDEYLDVAPSPSFRPRSKVYFQGRGLAGLQHDYVTDAADEYQEQLDLHMQYDGDLGNIEELGEMCKHGNSWASNCSDCDEYGEEELKEMADIPPVKPKKKKGARSLKGLKKVLVKKGAMYANGDEFKDFHLGNPGTKEYEERFACLEHALENIIQDYHTSSKSKDSTDAALNEVTQIVEKLNAEDQRNGKELSYHAPISMETIINIDDLLNCKPKDDENESDYSKISEHIPITEPLF